MKYAKKILSVILMLCIILTVYMPIIHADNFDNHVFEPEYLGVETPNEEFVNNVEYINQNGAEVIFDINAQEVSDASEIQFDEKKVSEAFNIDTNSVSLYSDIGTEKKGFIAAIDDPDASAVKITTAEELYNIRNDLYGNYVLANDIDLSDYSNWTPIGTTLNSAFHGKFDGQGYSITGLVSHSDMDSATFGGALYTVGLFGVCDGAEIKNVHLDNVDVSMITTSGYGYQNSTVTSDYSVFAGSLIGYACNDTVVYNCNSSGTVLSKAYSEGYSYTYAGGLVGFANSVIVSHSYNTCNVQAYNGNVVVAENAYAGGLVGSSFNPLIIDRSYNSGDITSQVLDYGNAYAGGLISVVNSVTCDITNSFNEGIVASQSGNLFCDDCYSGGICASFIGSINNVYNSGEVSANTVDPYGVGGGESHAGGICAVSSEDSTISNSAIVQPYVGASKSSNTYRISNGGVKTNNITTKSIVIGSKVDAEPVNEDEELKTSLPYTNILGWDFVTVWEMADSKDYPQLKSFDFGSDEQQTEYIIQHLNFIKGNSYSDFLKNERWAQIYWSEENNLASNMGERLYHFTDAIVDLTQLDFGFLFDDGNPYSIILADYIDDQTVQENIVELWNLEVPSALENTYAKTEKFIKDNWKDEWGELTDEDLFWLYHYEEKPAEEWIDNEFEGHLSEIVYSTRHSGDGIEKLLGVTTETADTILEQKKHLDNTIEWFQDLINYSANVEAYVNAEEEFKIILEEMCNNLPTETKQDRDYKSKLEKALKSYTQYNSEEKIREKAYLTYITESVEETIKDKIESVIKQQIKSTVTDWIKDTFSGAAIDGLNKIGWFSDKTWKIMEYVTKNGDIMECRESLRANAYFEKTMYNTLRTIENRFITTSTFENARLFDVAFKFFKETELYSMDICIQYCETYQASWLNAIKNHSNTFMNSFIEEVHIHKLYLYRTYCHGTTYNLGGKVITVACPTDVYVYDESDNIVASIENNKITKTDENILVYTADAIKLFVVPIGQNYKIKVNATDNGRMTYSVSEYNANLDNVQAVVYPEIDISNGSVFTGTIDGEINAEPETYNLKNETDDTEIDSYQQLTETNNIPIENITPSSDKEILNVGDTKLLNYTIFPQNATIKSVIWSSSDKSVVEVSEMGEITAKGEGNATITVRSVYGGVSAEIPIAVVPADAKHCIIENPQNATYILNETVNPLTVIGMSLDGSEITYQWYVTDNADGSDALPIDGAVSSTYIPDVSNLGIKYYYVELTSGEETIKSKISYVNVIDKRIINSGMYGEDLLWELDDKYCLTLSGEGDLNDFNSEADVPWDSYRTEISKLKIQGNISSIGQYAFTDMSSLTSIEIDPTVSNIAQGTFSGCSNVESVKLPFVGTSQTASAEEGVLGTIFGKVSSGGIVQYYGIEDDSLIGYRYSIPETLKSVEITNASKLSFGAFYNCEQITSITLNEGIKEIEQYSLCNCNGLIEIMIPNSVDAIEEFALKGCNNIKKITLPFVGENRESDNTNASVLGYIFGRCSSDTDGAVKQYCRIENDSVYYNYYVLPDSIETVKITDSVHIPCGAFSNCNWIKEIHVNDSSEFIGEYAFFDCSNLTDIVIPSTIQSISKNSFKNCIALKSMSLPFVGIDNNTDNTIESVLGHVFGFASEGIVQYCYNEGSQVLGRMYGIPETLTTIKITDAKFIPFGAFSNMDDLKILYLNNDIREIKDYAFYGTTGLTDIYFNGTENEWNNIIIGKENDMLNNVTIHYIENEMIYNLVLNLNEGILENDTDYTKYTSGIELILPIPKKNNCTFGGWYDNEDCEGEAVTSISANSTGDKEYWAKWTEQSSEEYLITFVNYDNTILQSDNVTVGEIPVYKGETPQKPSDDTYSYTFSGWSPEISEVSGIATYTAQFTAVPREYMVIFNTNYGVINSGNVETYIYGIGAILPTDVTKENYIFGGWYDNEDCEGEAVTSISANSTGDKEYWAKWTEQSSEEYLITFVNYDNTILQSDNVTVGEIPVYKGETPQKPSDDTYSYTFSGWSPEISEVSGIATYTAQFARKVINYNVNYQNDGRVHITAPQAGTYCVIFATYNDDTLVEVEMENVTFEKENDEISIQKKFSMDHNETVKIMLWNFINDMQPLCKAYVK